MNPKEDELKSFDFSLILIDMGPDLVGASLWNVGNTCYLNSILQCTIHTVPVVKKLRSSDHHYLICGNRTDFCSHCALRKLVDLCMDKSGWSIAPLDFIINLKTISPDFKFGEQQDAHEFLICFLGHLNKSCLDPTSDYESSMYTDTLVEQVFGGRSISQLRCCECGDCSITPETFFNISLEITDADTLVDALELFTKLEKIDDHKFTCERCNSQVYKEKQIKIDHAPTVISLHLKRFRNNGQFIDKIDTFVEYPLELDIRPYMSCASDEDQTLYDLYAVLVHCGESSSSGHYYCLIRSSPVAWHLMDDESVTRVSETNALCRMAYILFYIKQDSSPWFSSLMEEEQNMKYTLPKSVINHMIGVLFPSSAQETSSSGSCSKASESEETACSLHFVSPESADDYTPSTSYNASKSGTYFDPSGFLDMFDDYPFGKLAEKEEDNSSTQNCSIREKQKGSVSKSSHLISKPKPLDKKRRKL